MARRRQGDGERVRKVVLARIVSQVSVKETAWLERMQGSDESLVESYDRENEIVILSSSLSAAERAYVHVVASEHGLFHWSAGEPRRVACGHRVPDGVSLFADSDEELEEVKPQASFRTPVDTRRYRSGTHPFADTVEALARSPPSYAARDKSRLRRAPALVETTSQLEALVACLRKETEFAVDLEANSERSYNGICCLLQIATRDGDYVIDALKLHDDMNVLAPVFADASILKVFHACESVDIPALHRDFGIFVVNLFDTQRAAACLVGRGRLGLVALLERFDVVDSARHAALKATYQCCDWLKRPLNPEQIEYAALDVAHLLDLKDALLDALASPHWVLRDDQPVRVDDIEDDDDLWDDDLGVPSDCVQRVHEDDEARATTMAWALSQRACLQLWRPRPHPAAALDADKLFKREKKNFNARQTDLFAKLFMWRDDLARTLDESPNFVCPGPVLVALAKHCPTTKLELAIAHHPLPRLIRKRIDDLLDLVNATLGPDAALVKNKKKGRPKDVAPTQPPRRRRRHVSSETASRPPGELATLVALYVSLDAARARRTPTLPGSAPREERRHKAPATRRGRGFRPRA